MEKFYDTYLCVKEGLTNYKCRRFPNLKEADAYYFNNYDGETLSIVIPVYKNTPDILVKNILYDKISTASINVQIVK